MKKLIITDLAIGMLIRMDMGESDDVVGAITEIDLKTGLISIGDCIGTVDDIIEAEPCEIHIHFKENGVYFIDAFFTSNQDEEGVVIGTINTKRKDGLLIVDWRKPEYKKYADVDIVKLELEQFCKDYDLKMPTNYDLANLETTRRMKAFDKRKKVLSEVIKEIIENDIIDDYDFLGNVLHDIVFDIFEKYYQDDLPIDVANKAMEYIKVGFSKDDIIIQKDAEKA